MVKNKKMSIQLNKEGTHILGKVLDKLHSEFLEVDVYVSNTGLTFASKAASGNIAFRLNIEPKGLTDDGMKMTDEIRVRLDRKPLTYIFKKAKLFTKATWEFFGDITFILENERGLKNVTVIRPNIILEDEKFKVISPEEWYNSERKFEVKLKPDLLKDILIMSSSYVNDNDITIEKAIDTFRIISKKKEGSTISQFTVGEENDIKWLEGDDGALMTFYSYIKDSIECLDKSQDLTIVVAEEIIALMKQVTDHWSLYFGIAGKAPEDVYDPDYQEDDENE